MNRTVFGHIVASGAAIAAVIAVGAVWLMHYTSYPRGTGFDDLSGVFVPFLLILLILIWLAARALIAHRVRWRTLTVFVTAAAFAVAPVFLYCGPACFAPGPSRFMGWFIVAGVVIGALVHHLLLERYKPEAPHA